MAPGIASSSLRGQAVEPFMTGLRGLDRRAEPLLLVSRPQRPRGLQVALVLLPARPRLEVQRDLGVEVADAVVSHPGRLLEGDDVRGPALARPPPVPVRSDRDVDDPG